LRMRNGYRAKAQYRDDDENFFHVLDLQINSMRCMTIVERPVCLCVLAIKSDRSCGSAGQPSGFVSSRQARSGDNRAFIGYQKLHLAR